MLQNPTNNQNNLAQETGATNHQNRQNTPNVQNNNRQNASEVHLPSIQEEQSIHTKSTENNDAQSAQNEGVKSAQQNNVQSAQNQPVEAENDLYIASHIETEDLPALIRPVMALAQSPAEKDILLLSLLTATSSCLPKLYFRYGITGKRYYPNLQCFIVGSAASGKGIANLALEMVRPIHEQKPLLIPGDSTFPSFYRRLMEQGGHGYIHESEGSVITDIWRASTTTYNTALRKAAEHEPISRNRVREWSEIRCPQLSMLLTGTFSQYKALVPSVENGYFSRLLTLVVEDVQSFSSSYVEQAAQPNIVLPIAARRFEGLYERLSVMEPIEFSLTAEQRTRLGQHLANAYPTLMRLLGQNFHSVVLRMAVHIERIALILSVLRMVEPGGKFTSGTDNRLQCIDQDYRIAELIGNKLILHMAAAYRFIRGNEFSKPVIQKLNQRDMLFSLLPEEYESQILVQEAKAQGISRNTALRWNDTWQTQGLIMKVKHGCYKKIA